VFLHRDKRRDVSAADGASLLSLDQLLTTALAHTEMAARHYESVLGVTQADQALSFRVVINDLLTLFSTLIFGHTVDRLQFER